MKMFLCIFYYNTIETNMVSRGLDKYIMSEIY